jgi:2-polyprenyl-3-methyl-5-hydroxy-6-metoxy-1,4-benzoquinol methylase
MIFIATLSVYILTFLFNHSDVPNNNFILYSIFFMQEIMWNSWGANYKNANISPNINESEVNSRRSSYYIEKNAIQIFQNSLTCQEVDATYGAQLIKGLPLPANLKILDIGGGEGRFTASLVNTLQQNGSDIIELVAIDPVNWEKEYQNNLANILPLKKITFLKTDFEHFDPDTQYDLVVASHSLYATLDQHDLSDAKNNADRLLSFSNPEGLTLLIMASRRGLSYHFKKRAIQNLFGTNFEDINIESFQRAFNKRILTERYVDNLIDLTDIIKDYHDGGIKLYQWLSYFLRYNINALNKTIKVALVNMLFEYVRPLDSFPENECQQWLNLPSSLSLNRNSMVLMHKTKVLVLK